MQRKQLLDDLAAALARLDGKPVTDPQFAKKTEPVEIAASVLSSLSGAFVSPDMGLDDDELRAAVYAIACHPKMTGSSE